MSDVVEVKLRFAARGSDEGWLRGRTAAVRQRSRVELRCGGCDVAAELMAAEQS